MQTTEPRGAVGGLVGHRQSMVDNSSQNDPNLKSLTLKILLGVFLLALITTKLHPHSLHMIYLCVNVVGIISY